MRLRMEKGRFGVVKPQLLKQLEIPREVGKGKELGHHIIYTPYKAIGWIHVIRQNGTKMCKSAPYKHLLITLSYQGK